MATAAAHVQAGIKRKSSDIGDHERLAKRFEILNLDANGHKHYLPVASEAQQLQQQQQQQQHVAPPTAPTNLDPNGLMEVEDTRDKVFIHDLDKELAELESDDEHPIFIPDIDRHLNRLPRLLLEGREPSSTPRDSQLVLYSVPASLSLAQDEDNVRKVLIESRNRARLEQRAKIKREQKEQRGEMDLEEPAEDEDDRPKRVFARLKWREPPPGGQAETPMPMHMEDAEESTPEPTGPASPSFTVEEMESDNDAMDLG